MTPDSDLQPLAEAVGRFHRLSVEREVILRAFVADAVEADTRQDYQRAELLVGLAAMLRLAEYTWDASAQRWCIAVPGHPPQFAADPTAAAAPVEPGMVAR